VEQQYVASSEPANERLLIANGICIDPKRCPALSLARPVFCA